VIANLDVVIEELREVHRQRNAGAIEELLEAATEARAGANEARKVVRSLKAFARSEDDQRSPQDVHQLLDQAIELTRNETRHRAKVVKAYGDLARVNADPSKLTQVFVHLLVNAAQALDGGRAHQNWIRIDTYSGEDGSAVIEVSDSGPGIAAPLLPRVFEPFLTTRPVGQGSGLGLAVSHGIVSSLAGQISAENLDGGGACIRVTLPAAAFDESARHSSMAPASSGVPEGTVLVIDDDVRVGRSLRRVLQRHHHVTVVERGSDALELIRAGQQFDVILCDLMMPEMTGMELFRELERYAPDVTHDVIFITGGAFSAEAEAFLARVPNQVIEKPFDPRNLRATIRTNVLLRRGGSDRSSSLG
jgi:CheY-like chemotaxis protein